MDVLESLASNLGRRDEAPNIQLAEKIAAANDKRAVKTLVDNLRNKGRHIRYDCIKALYETGQRKPALVAPHLEEILSHLTSKDNRMQWGAMTAIKSVARSVPERAFAAVPQIMDAAEKGTVVTKDQCVQVLAQLATVEKLSADVVPLLCEMVANAAINQLPSYAESAARVAVGDDKTLLAKTVADRLRDVEQGPKKIRLQKVLKQLRMEG